MERGKKISEAELEVMKAVWEAERPLTGAEIVSALKRRTGWEDSTSYTLIRRLTKKGALRQVKDGVFYYSPAVSQESYRLEQARELLDRVFGGSAEKLVSALVKDRALSAADVAELEKFWNEGEGNHE